MPSRQRSCAMNLNADGLSSMNTRRRLKMREVSGKRRADNVDEGDIGITPEAGIEFLQQRLNEAQMGLDALEDLARRNDISPGTLRGQ